MKDPLSAIFRDLAKAPESMYRDVESNIQNMVDWLVARGKLSQEDAKFILADLASRSTTIMEDWEERVNYFIGDRVRVMKLPKREKLTALRKRLNSLFDRIDVLETEIRKKKNSR